MTNADRAFPPKPVPTTGRRDHPLRRTARWPDRVAALTVLGLLVMGAGVGFLTSGVARVSATSTTDPFAASWDVPLSPDATVAPDSAQLVANLVTQYEDNYGAVHAAGGNYGGYPIVTVPADQPLVPIEASSGCNDFTGETGAEVPIPASAASLVSGSGDSALVVWQPSTDTEWEFWIATDATGTWQACWGGEITHVSTADPGVFPTPYGLSASGIPYLGTMITEADVESGSINHMIALQVELGDCNGFVFPADRSDCGSAPGQVAEGQELRFPASMAMPSGLTPFEQMVFRAIQNYGMIVTDQSGGVQVPCETDADWYAAGNTGTDPITASWGPPGTEAYQALLGMPWSQLQVIEP